MDHDDLNRLTNLAMAKSSTPLASYAYTLGATGNRTGVTELSGRKVAYGYDSLYRLTSEAITADPGEMNGTVSYAYDAVGNRQKLTSTLAAIPGSGLLYYDANDRTSTDVYDDAGNTINSGGIVNAYDFENHLIRHGDVVVVYDGDGNRVAETVGGVTTQYLVDTSNPTGYAQVVEELQNNSVSRAYTWGLELISETQLASAAPPLSNWTTSWYGFDGHSSVRELFDSTGSITDSYTYDAFGNLIAQTGTIPNNYLFAGEQFDPALNLYYNRARYLDVRSGRFWGMDEYEGDDDTPMSSNKYLFVNGAPVSFRDRSGNEIDELASSMAISITMNSMPQMQTFSALLAAQSQVGKVSLGPQEGAFERMRKLAMVAVYCRACAEFLLRWDVDLLELWTHVGNQQAYDGTESAITRYNAGAYPESRDGDADSLPELKQSVREFFHENAGVEGLAQTGGRGSHFDVYYRPSKISSALIIHESLHNLTGLNDPTLAQKLGWGGGGSASKWITVTLASNRCGTLRSQ